MYPTRYNRNTPTRNGVTRPTPLLTAPTSASATLTGVSPVPVRWDPQTKSHYSILRA